MQYARVSYNSLVKVASDSSCCECDRVLRTWAGARELAGAHADRLKQSFKSIGMHTEESSGFKYFVIKECVGRQI